MSTKKLFACIVAVLVLLYASGCCETNDCYPVRSVALDCNQPIVSQPMDCPPAVTHPVVTCRQVVKCRQPVKCRQTARCRPACKPVRSPKKVRYANCLQPADHCYLPADPCAGNPPLLCDSAAVRQVVVVQSPVAAPRRHVAPARRPVAVDCPPVVQVVQPPREQKVRGRTRTVIPVVNNNVSGARARTYAAPQIQPMHVPASSRAAMEDGSVASIPSVVFDEDMEQEPVAAKSAPEKPAPAAATAGSRAGTLLDQMQEQPSSVRRIDSAVLEEGIAEPIVSAPVASGAPAVQAIPSVQPVLEQAGPSRTPAQESGSEPLLMTRMPLVEPYDPTEASVAGARAGQRQETWNPVCVPAQPDEPRMTSTYCPPDICPVPFAPLCEPNQNMSDCFVMNENQLRNSPQVYTPDAMSPLPIPIPPPPPQEFKTVPETRPAPAAAAPAATRESGTPSKYEALTPVSEAQRPDMRRVELSMPAPLGTGNIPPVPAPSEIESAVDAMLSRENSMSTVPGALK